MEHPESDALDARLQQAADEISRNPPDRLTTAARGFELTASLIRERDIKDLDLVSLSVYLRALTDHGHAIASLASAAANRSGPNSAVVPNWMSVELYFGHSADLFEAAASFATLAGDLLRNPNRTDPEPSVHRRTAG